MTSPLPTPGQRVSAVPLPDAYRLPAKPDGASSAALDAFRQASFVLRGDLALFEEGMNLQLRLLRESSHSSLRTHRYAAVIGLWSRAYSAIDDACLLITRGSYAGVPNLVRSACELIAAEHQVQGEEYGDFVAWLIGHLQPEETHKSFDVGLGHYFAGSTLAADEGLRPVYRAASDLGRPNFGATLLLTAPESNNLRLAYAFADAAFHVGWAEIELGWLLRLCERQLATAVHMRDVFNIAAETHDAYTSYAQRVAAALAVAGRAHITEVEQDGFKRWLFHNFRRQPSAAPKRYLL